MVTIMTEPKNQSDQEKTEMLLESAHLEHRNLAFGEETVASARYIAFGQTGKAYAVEGYNFVSDLLEDAAYDAVLTGVDLKTDMLAVFVGELQCIGDDHLVVEHYAVTDRLFVFTFEVAVKNNRVDLFLAELRVCEFGSQVAVVGEQQHTCRIAVKTTNRVDALRTSVLDYIHYRAALLGIVGGCYGVLGLVQQNIYFPLALNGLMMEHHLVRGQHFGAEAVNDLAVDGYYTGLNEVVCFTTAAESCVGKILVQAYRLRGIFVALVVLYLFALRIDAAVAFGLSVTVGMLGTCVRCTRTLTAER